MWRLITALVVLTVLRGPAFADDDTDVCLIRPDLCTDQIQAPRHTAKPARNPDGSRCRVRNQPFRVEDADLPFCRAQVKRSPASVSSTASQIEDSAAFGAESRPDLAADYSPAVTFDTYMASNARNPALAGKIPDHQYAFADVKRTAVIDFPMDHVSTKENQNPLGTTPANGQQQAGAGAGANQPNANGTFGATGFTGTPGTSGGGISLPAGFDPKSLPPDIQNNLPALLGQPQPQAPR